MAKKRDCYNCKHCPLCFLYRKVFDSIQGVNIINIDNPDSAPGTWKDIFTALARACLEYKEV